MGERQEVKCLFKTNGSLCPPRCSVFSTIQAYDRTKDSKIIDSVLRNAMWELCEKGNNGQQK